MNKLLPKTFLWMFIGLIVTFLTGYIVASNTNMLNTVFNSPIFYLLMFLELGLVVFLSIRVHKMSPTTAKFSFLLYSFISGLTFSSIFVGFKMSSLIYIFLIAAIIFAIFGAIGYFTNLDLSKISTYLLMGLIAVVICVIINMFFNNSTFDLIISIISLLIFLGFTAYDVQRIKLLSNSNIDNDVLAIHGALELYLDFINIFIHLLQLFGDNK